MHTAQSIHSSGSMMSMFGPSRKQSTGHTSTQSVYLHLMQDSVTTWVIRSFSSDRRNGKCARGVRSGAGERLAGLTPTIVLGRTILKQVLHKAGTIRAARDGRALVVSRECCRRIGIALASDKRSCEPCVASTPACG